METLTLKEAAKLLKMHPETLREKAKSGAVPGAKLGKSWVFVLEDLVNYIRSQYASPRQAVQVTNQEEYMVCHCTEEVTSIGSGSRRQMDDEYAALLGL